MTPSKADQPKESSKCGEPAAPFIPRWGMSRACVLPKGHEGSHQQGGNCFKHGEYVGDKCPRWPDCAKLESAGERIAEWFYDDPLNKLSAADLSREIDNALAAELAELLSAADLSREIDNALAAELAELRAELARYKKSLEGLTPSGSEFVDEPERCAMFVKEIRASQHNQIVLLTKRAHELEAKLEHCMEAIGEAAVSIEALFQHSTIPPSRERIADVITEKLGGNR